MDLTGKVAIVTGASRGVGAATARRARGRRRARSRAPRARPTRLRCRCPGTIDDTVRRIEAAGGRAIAVPTNLAVDAEVEAMVATTVDRLGPVDILVNNAAITFPGDLDLPMKRFDLIFAVDLRAPVIATAGRRARDDRTRDGRDRERVVRRRAERLSRPDGVRDGEGRARALHRVAAAEQLRPHGIPVNTFRIDVPVASEGFLAALPGLRPLGLGAARGRGRGDPLDARASRRPTPGTTRAWPGCAPSTGSWRRAPPVPTSRPPAWSRTDRPHPLWRREGAVAHPGDAKSAGSGVDLVDVLGRVRRGAGCRPAPR